MNTPPYPEQQPYPPPPPPPIPAPHVAGPTPYGSVFDSRLVSDALPPLPEPTPPGAVFDSRLVSDALPPLPYPVPPPNWNFEDGLGREQATTPVASFQAQQAVVFESAVRAEIKKLEAYFTGQTRRFRLFGMATVVCAAAVPVLIAAGVWSWLAALFGAVAAVSGSLQTLYRYQDSALSAMTLANNLEAEVVRYQTGTTPYTAGPQGNFAMFVDRVTNLRGEATTSFSGVWSSAQVSTGA